MSASPNSSKSLNISRTRLDRPPLTPHADDSTVQFELREAYRPGDRERIEHLTGLLLERHGAGVIGTDRTRLVFMHATAVAAFDVSCVADLPAYWQETKRALGWTELVVDQTRGPGNLRASIAAAHELADAAIADATAVANGAVNICNQITHLSMARDLPTADALAWSYVQPTKPMYGHAKLCARIRHDISPADALPYSEAALAHSRDPAVLNTRAASLRQVGRLEEALRLAGESMVKAPNRYAANTTGKIAEVLGMHGLQAMCDQLRAAAHANVPETHRRSWAIQGLTRAGLRDVAELGLHLLPTHGGGFQLRSAMDRHVLQEVTA